MAILITPKATEKAYRESQNNTYVFDVPLDANKNQISDAVAEQFDVTVKSVRVAVQSGKAIRYSRGKNRYPGSTTRKDSKKAYVTLADGNSIKLFEEEQQAEATDEKGDK